MSSQLSSYNFTYRLDKNKFTNQKLLFFSIIKPKKDIIKIVGADTQALFD